MHELKKSEIAGICNDHYLAVRAKKHTKRKLTQTLQCEKVKPGKGIAKLGV